MMKRTYIASALILVMSVFTAVAQDSIKVEGAKKKLRGKDRLMIGMSLDNWLNSPSGVEPRVYSPGFNVALVYDYPLAKSSFSLAGGLGFSSYNIHSNAQPKTLRDDEGEAIGTYFEAFPDSIDYKTNKLSVNYIEVPVEIRFRSRGDKSYRRFGLAAGFKVGYLVQSHTKYKDESIKFKYYNINFLNNFRYGPTVRVSYGKISLFGFYSLSDLFEEGKGPDVTPISAGIFIVPY